MQRQLSLTKSDEGVSPVIGTILILAIMLTVTGTMLAWGIPQIQQNEAYAIYTSAQNNLLNFDTDLDHVLAQGEGASRTSTISFSSVTFVHREKLDEIIFQKLKDRQEDSDKRFGQIKEQMDLVEKRIMNEILSMKNAIGSRVNVLEKWKYLIIGGSIVIGFILARNFPLVIEMIKVS